MTKSKSFTFVFVFDKDNVNFRKEPEYNHLFIQNQMRYWEDVLGVNGVVFLNEVLQSFGIKRIPDGQLMGWTSSKSKVISRMISVHNGDIMIKLMTDGNVYREL